MLRTALALIPLFLLPAPSERPIPDPPNVQIISNFVGGSLKADIFSNTGGDLTIEVWVKDLNGNVVWSQTTLVPSHAGMYYYNGPYIPESWRNYKVRVKATNSDGIDDAVKKFI